MKKKSLQVAIISAAISAFSPTQSTAENLETRIAQVENSSSGFFEHGYEEQQTLPDLMQYLIQEWKPIMRDLSERDIKITDRTSPLRFIIIFGFNAPNILKYDNLGLRNLEKLDYKRKSYILEEGVYTLELERVKPKESQNKFVRLEFNLKYYPEIKSNIVEDISPYIENPELEKQINPLERKTYSGDDWVHRITFY